MQLGHLKKRNCDKTVIIGVRLLLHAPTENTRKTCPKNRHQNSPLAETETCENSRNIEARGENALQTTGNESIMNPNAIEFQPTAGLVAPSIGQDLWKQLKRVQIPRYG